MRFTYFITAAAASLAGLAQASPTANEPLCPPRPATQAQQSRSFADYVNQLYVQKNVSAALLDHVSEEYIQHNPSILSGRQTAINALSSFWPFVTLTVLRSAVGGGYGWVHTKAVEDGQVKAVSDIFRFNGTCIMEHWDVMQDFPVNSSNPIALF